MFEVTSAITRRWFIVVGTAVAGLILSGLIGLLARTSTYTARSQVLVDQPLLVPDSAGASVPTKFGSSSPRSAALPSAIRRPGGSRRPPSSVLASSAAI